MRVLKSSVIIGRSSRDVARRDEERRRRPDYRSYGDHYSHEDWQGWQHSDRSYWDPRSSYRRPPPGYYPPSNDYAPARDPYDRWAARVGSHKLVLE